MLADPARFRARRLALTALVDVIFLLLLFFMLTTSFARYGTIELGTPAAEAAGALPDHLLRVDGERVTLNGRAVPLTELAARLAPGEAVLVTVADGVAAQRLVDVLLLLGALPGLRVAVVP